MSLNIKKKIFFIEKYFSEPFFPVNLSITISITHDPSSVATTIFFFFFTQLTQTHVHPGHLFLSEVFANGENKVLHCDGNQGVNARRHGAGRKKLETETG